MIGLVVAQLFGGMDFKRVLPYWRLIVEILVALALIWGTWRVAAWRHAAKQEVEIAAALSAQKATYDKDRALADLIGRDLETRLAEAQKKVKTLNRKLSDEVANHAVYRQCKPTADSVRFLNEAARGD